MIVPMKKVSLVVQDSRRDEALAQLREVGVMHIETSKPPSDKLAEILERRARVESAIALVNPFKIPPKKDDAQPKFRRSSDRTGSEEQQPYSTDAVNSPGRPELVDLLLEMGEERGKLEEKYALLAKERGRIAPWGEFDPADIDYLAERGVCLHLYELSPDALKNIPDEIRYIKISEGKSSALVLALGAKIPELQPFRLPEKTLSRIDAELREAKNALDALNERIKSFANRRPILEKTLAEVQLDFDFEKARTELEKVEGLPLGLGISYLTGFAPSGELGRLKSAAAQNGWALAADDPGPEDAPPTELKNNAVTKMITPLTGFLDLLPGYNERDVSGWFLLFVTIFFGMILGDAAYGVLFFLIALIGMIKTAKKGVPIAFRMLMLFSVGNIAWGTVTGTWFAIEAQHLPQFLIDISLPQFSMARGTSEALVNENLQVFCFTLALFHLSIARLGSFIRGVRDRKLKCLANLGSIGMLIGMYNLVLMLVVNPVRFPMHDASLFLLAGGFALSFLFSYYERNPLQAILGSLQNIFPVVLGVTGIFSDIMSYIRLWAVGLAGVALAGAFNSMAGPMLGNFLIFFGMLVLVAGHGLNIALNTLSVLVHGVRLNILEFSGHAGLTWSGIPYKPFADSAARLAKR